MLKNLLTSMLLIVVSHTIYASCEVSIQQNAINYQPTTSADALKGSPENSNGYFVLERPVKLVLTTTCESEQAFLLSHNAISNMPQGFQFDRAGYYTLYIKQAKVGDKPVRMRYDDDKKDSAVSLFILPNKKIIPLLDDKPASGTQFTVEIELKTWVSEAYIKQINNKENWQTNGTFYVK